MLRRTLAITLVALSVALSVALPLRAEIAPVYTDVRPGLFTLDPAHSRLVFRVSHLGFSMYTAFFTDVTAELAFDPTSTEAIAVAATIATASVETLHPDPQLDLNAIISGPTFLDADRFAQITFSSTSVRLTAPDTAAVTGDLTLHGVTRPITLRVHFNAGYAGHPADPTGARLGFSATGTVFRSDFGITAGLPPPGSDFGIGDAVEIVIEAELVNPDATGPQLGP